MAFLFVYDQDDSRRSGVIEEVFRKKDHGLNEVILYELLADVALAVCALDA